MAANGENIVDIISHRWGQTCHQVTGRNGTLKRIDIYQATKNCEMSFHNPQKISIYYIYIFQFFPIPFLCSVLSLTYETEFPSSGSGFCGSTAIHATTTAHATNTMVKKDSRRLNDRVGSMTLRHVFNVCR